MNKSTILVTILAIIAAGALYKTREVAAINEIPNEVIFAFNQWKLSQKRLYFSPEEQNHRLSVFHTNYIKVNQVNEQKLSYTFKLNDFADLSHEEFVARYLQKPVDYKTPEDVQILTSEDFQDLPNSLTQVSDLNWCDSTRRACSAVRKQGTCASGYAFASSKVLEYANNVAKKSSNKWLSPQEYIDCSANFGNGACQGGYIANSMKYSITYGLNYDANYQYIDRQQPCKGVSNLFKPRSFSQISSGDNLSIQTGLTQRPWAVSLDASRLQFYSQGIYDGPCSTTSITHFMTLIGFGQSGGKDYWRLENSWGTAWGQSGYIFMRKYQGKSSEPCGVPNYVTGPLV